MALFTHLDDNFFLPFSRANKHFHEACLVRVYERFYKDAPRFPRDNEVVAEIYETLRGNPDFLSLAGEDDLADLPEMKTRGRRRASIGRNMGGVRQEVVDAARNMAVRTYDNLIAWGWLEEERFGIVVTVDMSPGGLAVMETLYRIREGFALQFSGTLVQLNLALDGIRADPRRNAPSLWNVRRDLESFVRHLRAILADLKRIRSEMVEGEGQRARVAIFFESFVKRLLLKDFAAIHTTNHPYRYKAETLAKVTRLASDRHTLRAMAETYAEHEDPQALARPEAAAERRALVEAAEARVVADFEAVHGMLNHVDAMFERIRDFQEKLETRLRNMLRYRNRGRRDFADRLEGALDRLVAVAGRRPQTLDAEGIVGYLDHYERPFAVHLHARPPRERQPVGAAPVAVRLPDPVDLHLQRLKKAYLRRLHPGDAQIRAFLDARLAGRRAVHASELVLETIDDFLAFDALHLMLRRGAVPEAIAAAFELRARPGGPRVDNAYIACDDFTIARKGDEQDAA